MNGKATINYKGETIPLKFGWQHIVEFGIAVEENPSAHFVGEIITDFGVARMIHTGYRNACLLKDIKPTITLEDISDWLDEGLDDENPDRDAFQKQVVEVAGVWAESRHTLKWVNNLKKKTALLNEELEKLKSEQEKQSKKSTKKSKQRSTQTGSDT